MPVVGGSPEVRLRLSRLLLTQQRHSVNRATSAEIRKGSRLLNRFYCARGAGSFRPRVA